jgi:hypothetical protein
MGPVALGNPGVELLGPPLPGPTPAKLPKASHQTLAAGDERRRKTSGYMLAAPTLQHGIEESRFDTQWRRCIDQHKCCGP